MSKTAIITIRSTEVMQRLRHFGDFVTVPLAIVIFVGLAGMYASRPGRCSAGRQGDRARRPSRSRPC